MFIRRLLKVLLVASTIAGTLSAGAQTQTLPPELAAKDEAIKAGIQLYYMKGCYGCHGPQAEGVLQKDAPRLAGLSEEYLVRQITHFRDGIRGSDFGDTYGRQMPMAVNSLSDQHVQLIAGFISTLPGRIPAEQGLPGNLEQGERIYKSSCQGCHGAEAEGNPALSTPRLAGQQDVYMARQIQLFKDGFRGVHLRDSFGKQMVAPSSLLTSDQDVIDVSVYVGSLQSVAESQETEDKKDVVVNYYKRLDAGDKNAIYDILDPDVVFHFPDKATYGANGYWGYVSQIGAYVPDFVHVLDGLTISEKNANDVVVEKITVEGHNAVGISLSFPGSARYRVENGKITEAWIQ